MKNGKYIIVIAPESYTMKKYRGRYCYEHHLVWWEHNGNIDKDEVIHHKNGDKHDNRIENLCVLSRSEHASEHGKEVSEYRKNFHGTFSSYKRRKCRCELCKKLWEIYSMKQNKNRRERRTKRVS